MPSLLEGSESCPSGKSTRNGEWIATVFCYQTCFFAKSDILVATIHMEEHSLNSKPCWSENVLFVINLIISIAVIFGIAQYFFAPAAIEVYTMRITVVIYLVFILFYVFVLRGLTIGFIQGNGVLVSPELFPELHATVVEQAQRLGIRRAPKVYVIQGGGLLNAFATKTLLRNYVVLYADIVEKAFEEGADIVSFIIAHELTHVKRHHVMKQLWTLPAFILFPLRLAYSRACEYTCDRFAAELSPGGTENALLLLAAGTPLYERVDSAAYLRTIESDRGAWKWIAEFISTHPILPRRIKKATAPR